MAIKKNLWAFFLITWSVQILSAQWKDDVARSFAKGKDYRAISSYLLQNFDKLENVDKADAAGLLAFCFYRLDDPKNETRWIVDYFDTYGGKDTGYAFLDLVSQADVIGWLNSWKSRFPWIIEIALVKGVGDQVIIPQGILPLVIDIANDAYYKFSAGADVLEGGQFKPGFNIIGLDANELFLNPGKRVYFLELKAGDLVLKKEIDLDIDVSGPPASPRPAAAAARRPVEYTLSLYVGSELVMTSKKTEYPVSWKIDVKPSNAPFGFSPDSYINRNKPGMGVDSFSILSAIGMLYSLLKDLFKKKTKDAEPPKIQTVQDLTLTFKQKDAEGRDQEMKVSLRLRTKNL